MYNLLLLLQKQLQDAEYGSDLPSVQHELEIHQREHKTIEQFQTRLEHCSMAKVIFIGNMKSMECISDNWYGKGRAKGVAYLKLKFSITIQDRIKQLYIFEI